LIHGVLTEEAVKAFEWVGGKLPKHQKPMKMKHQTRQAEVIFRAKPFHTNQFTAKNTFNISKHDNVSNTSSQKPTPQIRCRAMLNSEHMPVGVKKPLSERLFKVDRPQASAWRLARIRP
jgi:hypothetical protein